MKNNGRNRRIAIRRRQSFVVRLSFGIFFIVCLFIGIYLFLVYERESRIDYAAEYEKAVFDAKIFRAAGFSTDLCVSEQANVAMDNFQDNDKLSAAALFELPDRTVDYAYHMYDRIYPASTTKLLTAFVALKKGNMQDIVTVGDEVSGFSWDEQVIGLSPGEQLSMYDLMCGLLLYSGNDAAAAIAKHISGSQEAFVEEMNREARSLGATGTHFVNPHGLHNEQHYTTAYDLYLIMNACLKNDTFQEIIGLTQYEANVTGTDGQVRQLEWKPTNYYSAGLTNIPDNVKVIGGKTGTTDEAGSCLVLYAKDVEDRPYISIVMGAPEKLTLYDEMSSLMARGMPQKGTQ